MLNEIQNGSCRLLEVTSNVNFAHTACFHLQLLIFLKNLVNVSQPAVALLHFVEKFEMAMSAILYHLWSVCHHTRRSL